jgi:hypothetical protein
MMAMQFNPVTGTYGFQPPVALPIGLPDNLLLPTLSSKAFSPLANTMPGGIGKTDVGAMADTKNLTPGADQIVNPSAGEIANNGTLANNNGVGGVNPVGDAAGTPAVTQGAINKGATVGGANVPSQGSAGTGTDVIADPVTASDGANKVTTLRDITKPIYLTAPVFGDAMQAPAMGTAFPVGNAAAPTMFGTPAASMSATPASADAIPAPIGGTTAANSPGNELNSQNSGIDSRLGGREDYDFFGFGREYDALKKEKDDLAARIKDAAYESPEARQALQKATDKVEGKQDNLKEQGLMSEKMQEAMASVVKNVLNGAFDAIKKAAKPKKDPELLAAKKQEQSRLEQWEEEEMEMEAVDQPEKDDGEDGKSSKATQLENEIKALT